MKKSIKLKQIKNEYFGKYFSVFCGILIIILTLAIILFITYKGIRTFIIHHYPIREFLFSFKWVPDEDKPKFGAAVFLLGSISVSIGAVVLSTPIGIALAIFMNHISPKLGKKIIQPAMELFVGIPSVVYGWIGISILIPLIKKYFNGVGFSLLAGIIVLSIMILPTITSIASDSIKAISKDYVKASYALGATRSQTILKVVLPSAKNGILTGIVLGLARAFGEALAVQMVIGNSTKIVKSLISPTTTLTSIITMDMANTFAGTAWNDALWSLALLLLIISFIFILIIKLISKRGFVK